PAIKLKSLRFIKPQDLARRLVRLIVHWRRFRVRPGHAFRSQVHTFFMPNLLYDKLDRTSQVPENVFSRQPPTIWTLRLRSVFFMNHRA
ncbi:MAG: hypothetical protein ACKPE2_00435, partial [Dolichospermum sp.]